MSLLIKGMDMPRNCKDCPCREYGKFSYEPDWCCLNRKNIVNAKTISPNCPLIPLPQKHGRLTEENDVLKEIRRFKGYLDEDMIWRIEFAIKKRTKAIIEAEE